MPTSKLEVPHWMDEKFQKTCIGNAENWEERDIVLNSIEVDHTVPLGVNFTSIIYDMKIGFSLVNNEVYRMKSFVVKIVLELEDVIALDADTKIFSRELDMYEVLLPELQKVLNKAGIQRRIACKCVYSSNTPFMIAMENLKVDGYEMADKYIGLDLEHCKMTLERLAMLHGASMRYYTMKKTIPEKSLYYMPLVSDTKFKRDAYTVKCKNKIMEIINILAAKGCYEIVIQYLKRSIGDLDVFGYFCQQFEYISGNKFNALLHGDAWISNAMFKYDENRELKDVMLFDYQFSNYASVANDFLFFFFSSANDDVREHHFATLIAYYHECLANVLKRLGYTEDIPTAEDFKAELKRACGCGLNMLFNMLPALRGAKSISTDEDNENGSALKELWQRGLDYFITPEYQKTLFLGIDSLKAEGFFDHLP